ncbi:MAG: hypothetical protein ABI175_16175, partial [Polyangiales bacterium]
MRVVLPFAALFVSTFVGCVGCSSSAEKPVPKDTGTPPPAGWRAAVGAAGAFAQTFDDVRWSSRTIADVSFYGV